jgi:hypothetical protein
MLPFRKYKGILHEGNAVVKGKIHHAPFKDCAMHYPNAMRYYPRLAPVSNFPRLKIESVPTFLMDCWLRITIPSTQWNVGTIDFQDLGEIGTDAILCIGMFYSEHS